MTRIRLLGFGVSAASIGWLVHSYDFSALPQYMARLGAFHAVAAILVIFVGMALRARRWQVILGSAPPAFGAAFSATTIGYTFNNVLPGRAGDLIKVYALAERAGIPKGRVLGSVVVEKVADVVVLVGLLAFVTVGYPLPGWFGHAARIIMAIALLAVLILVGSLALGSTLVTWVSGTLNRVSPRLGGLARSAMTGFADGIRGLGSRRRLLAFIGVTTMIWVTEVALVWFVSSGFGFDLSPLDCLYVLLIIALGTMVPSSPGYIGTYELFGVNAMALLGHPRHLSLAFVVALHGIVILGTSVPGAIALMRVRRRLPAAAPLVGAVPEGETV